VLEPAPVDDVVDDGFDVPPADVAALVALGALVPAAVGDEFADARRSALVACVVGWPAQPASTTAASPAIASVTLVLMEPPPYPRQPRTSRRHLKEGWLPPPDTTKPDAALILTGPP
jgi:hypothetical protein